MFWKKSNLYWRLIRSRWELGFVRGGLDGVFSDKPLVVDWIINPFRDRWFADPFVLDVTEDFVFVLAEEYEFKTRKGRIAKLTVNRKTLRIDHYCILLELPTHLSFPNILRKNGHVYVYPESCYNGRLDLYEYDPRQERLVFERTICEDAVWDSSIVNVTGVPQLFTARSSDYNLDVYNWDDKINRFVYSFSVPSSEKSSRMAGQLFEYLGKTYMPSQYCETVYGGGVIIKEVFVNENGVSFNEIKKLVSPHPKRKSKLHTLNEYKGVVIIDVGGFDYPFIGKSMERMSQFIKRVRRK